MTCNVTGSNWCISGNNSSSGIGVIGTSKSGTGLRGAITSQYGLKATSGSNVAIYAQTTSGSNAITALGSSTGNGVNASAGGVELSGTSTNGGALGGAVPFVAFNEKSNVVYEVSDQGNIHIIGSVMPLTVTRGGATVTSFSSNSTRPTVEDSGSATLVRGAAAVRLDPTFAAAIDAGNYRVFLTPGGDTHGLFVAAKTAHGEK